MNQTAPDAKVGRADPHADLLADYTVPIGVADELVEASGRLRPVWRSFLDNLARFSESDLADRFARGDQYLRDAGVYFRRYGDEGAQERDWPLSHIPVLLPEREWGSLCAGLTERADLLERVMADLYGAGDLVADGHLPAELVAQNPQWLRPMMGIVPRSGHYLHLLAFELGRSPDGAWFVLGDRTQAPSGAGFALENRIATARVFPDLYQRSDVHRLAGFFRSFRSALDDLAGPPGQRRAILSPGPGNDAYFEHAYIARHLGLTLVEGEDMVVHQDRAMVRTVTGLEPVGVLWRRMDAAFADPLELNEASQIGTPGLVGALRQGTLSMVNALGAGVLETRALMAFLPRIAEVLTGAPLSLPNIATWWCGQPAERAYVKKNAADMLIGSALSTDLPFDRNASTAPGGAFRPGTERRIAEWIDADGAMLVGQEAVALSTTPAMVGGRLRPRPMTLRVFAARTDGGWRFMPGGYARIGPAGQASALAMQQGGSVADVWIVADAPVPRAGLLANIDARRSDPSVLPSRAADNLFWLGRYVERAEAAIRLTRAWHLRLAETGDPADPRVAHLSTLLAPYGLGSGAPGPDGLTPVLAAAKGCASKVRDRFSVDGWSALRDLSHRAAELSAKPRTGDAAARDMGVLLRMLNGFSGLVQENMYRSDGWRFLSFGRALERADTVYAALIELADPEAAQGALDVALELGDSVMTHQRRYRAETCRTTVVDLLLLDEDNPRSVLFQLQAMANHAAAMPHAEERGRLQPLRRALLEQETALQVAEPDRLDAERISQLRNDLGRLSGLLGDQYLR